MQIKPIRKRFWVLLLIAGSLLMAHPMSKAFAAEQPDMATDKTQQKEGPGAQGIPDNSAEQPQDKEKQNKEVQMLSDLYVDCLAVANYARYYLSEELLSPEDGDKICGEIADKSRSILELMKFSSSEIESFFEEAKQKAQKMLEEKFPDLQKKPSKITPDDTMASRI